MLKTTCKKAIENIRQYIENNFDPSNYDVDQPLDTFEQKARFILDTFREEKRHEFRRNVSEQEIFADWCSGLPSLLDTCYYYNRPAVDDLGAILEETEAEKSKYSESDAGRMLTYLIYRELRKAERK